MSQSQKLSSKLKVSARLNDLAHVAAHSYFSADTAFSAISCFGEYNKQRGRDLNQEQSLTVLRAGLHAGNFHFSNLVNSFEYYLENLVYELVRWKPELMLGKDTPDGNVKPAISYDELIRQLEKGKLDQDFIARKFTERFKTGKSYQKFIKLISYVVKKDILDGKSLSTLEWYFSARHQITHEGGILNLQKLSKGLPSYFKPTDTFVSRVALYEACHFIVYTGAQIEVAIQKKFPSFPLAVFEYGEVFAIIGDVDNLSKEFQTFVSGEQKYFEAAIARVQGRVPETSPSSTQP